MTALGNPSVTGSPASSCVEPDRARVDGDAGVARCPSCAALVDSDGRCWACAAPCARCGTRGDLLRIAGSVGDAVEVCEGCAAAWLDAVAGDFDTSVRVFAGTASAAERAEHAQAVKEREAADRREAEKKAAAAEARSRRLADQVDAVVALVEAADGPIRKKAMTKLTPFGVNATEVALSAAVKGGRVRVSAKGYMPNNNNEETT